MKTTYSEKSIYALTLNHSDMSLIGLSIYNQPEPKARKILEEYVNHLDL